MAGGRMSKSFYNEFDAYPAQWLRNLIKAGQISPGRVNEKSIEDVRPDELMGYTQAHFFAGIGGWDLALRLAKWPRNREVWTGSCPCQPFSHAGKGKGVEDERHLWPVFYRLIKVCRPSVIFGEQVTSRAGRLWLTGVRTDMEALGYAFGASDLCAAGISAPHIRQRLWWVAYAKYDGLNKQKAVAAEQGEDRKGSRLPVRGGDSGMWDEFDIAWCRDPREGRPPVPRRIESGAYPLAHGIPARVGKIRAYGNAIVPQIAAEFIKAFMDT